MNARQPILEALSRLDPRVYGSTRNFLDGAVTGLGPWITHGAITLREVAENVIAHHGIENSIPFLFQLSWREHFYRLWSRYREGIFADLKQPQATREREGVPKVILSGTTRITSIDAVIHKLIQDGSMHNHSRLWVSSLCCNIARCGWEHGARWMYYHLLDGDLASNTLSWQWVAGSASNKRYIANQENINRFSRSQQHKTFLDFSYEYLNDAAVPTELTEVAVPLCEPWIPRHECVKPLQFPVILYLPWNLDPKWRTSLDVDSENVTRLVWFDTELFTKFPISSKRGEFITELKNALPGAAQWFVGTAEQLKQECIGKIHARAHPLLPAWVTDPDLSGMLFQSIPHSGGSFMSFWKDCELQLRTSGSVA